MNGRLTKCRQLSVLVASVGKSGFIGLKGKKRFVGFEPMTDIYGGGEKEGMPGVVRIF